MYQTQDNKNTAITAQIQILFNDQAIEVDEELSLSALLALKNIDPQTVALVVNEQIVPRGCWSTHSCQVGDRIDAFTVVAGG